MDASLRWGACTGVAGGEDALGDEEDEEDREPPLHRLCPTYAQDINSPLRHVRTRIYFTSESHVHSLVNVLRFCHQGEAKLYPLLSYSRRSISRNRSSMFCAKDHSRSCFRSGRLYQDVDMWNQFIFAVISALPGVGFEVLIRIEGCRRTG